MNLVRLRSAGSGLLPGFVLAALLGCGATSETTGSEEYLADLASWKAEREARLRQPDGWLTLVGLSWLTEGVNTLGPEPTDDVVFPRGVGGVVGEMRVDGGRVTFNAVPGAGVEHEGRSVTTMTLETDASGEPTVLELGSLTFYVIERSEELGVRIKDREAETLRHFSGMEYFPVDPGWRIEGRFEAWDEPRTITVPNVLGTAIEEPVPGVISFEHDGRSFELFPIGEPDEELFIVFADATNGRETYGGGRFLYAGPPAPDGSIVLDFNRAYNPPCVFTPYATCPLPPPENSLDIEVRAGELTWEAGH